MVGMMLNYIETKNKKILSKLSSPSSSQIVNNFKLSNLVDESDEDSNLWSFNSLNNLEEEEDGEQNNEGLINDKGKEKNKKQKNNLLLPPDISQYSRLKQNELIKYQKFFPEFSLESFKQLIFDEFTNNECCQINEYKQIVLKEWKKINSVGNFVKIANPELFDCGDLINGKEENILENSINNSMKQIINEKLIEYKNQKGEEKKEEKNNCLPRIVFDLNEKKELLNNDCLNFESRFESGNLWKAIQVSTNKYELIISPDINQQTLHFQWFYFEVTNMRAGIPYIFEIINCLKNISMFSKGMQPVLFSLIEAKKGNIGWRRAGTEISYFRNLFKIPNDDERKENKKIGKNENLVNSKNNGKINKSKKQNNEDLQIMEKRNFSSLRFTLCFPHDEDVCYIAYHFPYTYTKLQSTIEWWISSSSSLNLFFYRQKLCSTLNKNFISLLTITTNKNIKSKQIILITSRVHPGESNSSWIIHGFIQFLLSSHPLAIRARDLFIFKIIPMLNPDGVINGSHRCSLVGQDLNRVEILKMPPFSFIDLHGHSRKPNIFMYGNNPLESWCPTDIANNSQQSKTFSLLPEILAKSSDSFSLKDCSFSITKAKEFSARVSIWRQFKLERVYTCESSYFGFDFGSKAGTQITITDLKRMGAELVEGLVYLREFNRATNLPDETNQKI
uniref:Peptidase M14 domain-containing protein n=1 Tax=Meloidogyne incognita TaxID=6306 RepID=A0A914NI39_MELIC